MWKRSEELTLLVHLQSSRWGPAAYVNFGVTPTAMVTRATPPGPGYWGWGRRGETFEGPHREQFRLIAVGEPDRLPSGAEIGEAFEWLFGWMEANWGDAERVRREIRAEMEREGRAPDQGFLMDDWAMGTLKDVAVYFGGTPYYRAT